MERIIVHLENKEQECLLEQLPKALKVIFEKKEHKHNNSGVLAKMKEAFKQMDLPVF